jgi:hypothetical protein
LPDELKTPEELEEELEEECSVCVSDDKTSQIEAVK